MKYTWAGWKTPPVAVDGEHAYVALDDRTLDVEWRAGNVSKSKGLPGAYTTEVINGRAVEGVVGRTQRVVDVGTGKVLLTVRRSDYPDGLVAPDRARRPTRPCIAVHDVRRAGQLPRGHERLVVRPARLRSS
ncbi:MAG: hypothetical protein M3306_07795 [Actinomycetota bacterium]|nr:hypothetical protein [Actinomycetota bacterium]